MGSSKKHREKDRETRKRHHRSRSRSKERERERDRHGQRDREKHRDRKERSRSREREKKRPRESLVVVADRPKVKDEAREAAKSIGGSGSGSGGGDSSLSIEETNKLRAKLGLKPLDTKESSSNKNESADEKKDFVHKPPENLSDKQFVEKLREKIATQKQKRAIEHKLRHVKTLGDSESEEDDVAHWVSKSRHLEEEKRKAEARAKLLEEMDEEFGIGNLVEDELRQLKATAYSERNLKGIKVEHAQSSFGEGKTVILTLKDKGVLDEEEGDVLVNVNIIDEEKAVKNIEKKKAKPGYVPYEEEMDEFGQIKPKSLLSKYDEEIDGEKATSFVLGKGGVARSESERARVRQKLQQQQGTVSLDLPVPKLASEYYTDEEMVKFKKPGKKVRKVHRKQLKADELLAISNEVPQSFDLGSRERAKVQQEVVEEDSNDFSNENSNSSVNYDTEDMDIEKDMDDYEILGPDEDLTNVRVEPDEAELELQLVLNKARKLRQKEELKSGADKVADNVKSFYDYPKDEDAGAGKGSIVLNATAEFCRALGDIPTYGMSGNRDEDVDDLMDFDSDPGNEKAPAPDEDTYRSSWNEVEVIDQVTEIKKEDVTILDEEPDVSLGIAGALQLAMKKGYLDKEVKKVVSAPRHSQLQATSYTIEDKSFLEDDRLGRRERFSAGPVTDFKDRDGYKPDVKLEYIDDNGRLLNPKEAFRYLSHKFHGKGSGKNKTEKRMKKLQEEALMKQMSSTDTPLGTLALLQEKQRQTQSPYIVLSGGSKAINASAISKTK